MSSETFRANGDNNNDAKRLKLEIPLPNPPSRVVHIRNIPIEITEAEVIHLGLPFGQVRNILVLKGKNQAFLEMDDQDAATAMVNYFTNCSVTLRERFVYVQFSKHQELRTDHSHSNSSASAQAALQAAQAMTGNDEKIASGKATSHDDGGTNTILRVHIKQMIYPVTLDSLHTIFSRFGNVLKIITFTKSNAFQALVQFPDVLTAQAAKLSLDGQSIYEGCCTLRINYSNLTNLNIRYNNDKSRDYTKPNLPRGDQLAPTSVLGLHFQAIANLSAFVNPDPLLSANPLALDLVNGTTISQNDALFSPKPAAVMAKGRGSQPGSVLIVSNLNEELIKCDHLFTLFGVYGDVMRVKILFKKKNTALIQMTEEQQAKVAMAFLDKVVLWDHELQVRPSTNVRVKLPKEGQEDTGLTKDYTTSILHRFKKPGSKNYANIYPPSATLHLSNIPPIEESILMSAFEAEGVKVKAFKFFLKDRKMALVQLDSIENAVIGLIKMHNHKLNETHHLRVSFSKFSL